MKRLISSILIGLILCQSLVLADTGSYLISSGCMAYASTSLGDNTASKMIDGNTTTRWESIHNTTSKTDYQWVYIDLGKKTHADTLSIQWEGAYATRYAITVSDDEENWLEIWNTDSGHGGTVTIPLNIDTRFIRIDCKEKSTYYGYSIYEVEVLGTGGILPPPKERGDNLALNKTVTASSTLDAWWLYHDGVLDQTSVMPQNAVDGNDRTSWTSAFENKQWFMVDLGAQYDIGEIVIDWDEDAGKVYDIQVSSNKLTWNTVYRTLNGRYEKLELSVYQESVRYLRIWGYARYTTGGFKIKELEVYEYQEGDPKPVYEIPALPQTKTHSYGAATYCTDNMDIAQAKIPVYKSEDYGQQENGNVIASNDWWQSMLIKRFGNMMTTLPLKVVYSESGLGILTATDGWIPDVRGGSVHTEETIDLSILPRGLIASKMYDRVVSNGDYSVTAQLCDEDQIGMTNTFVKGSPYVYCEFGDIREIMILSDSITEIYDENGSILKEDGDSYVGDHIGIQVTDADNADRTRTSVNEYCICAPEGTVWKYLSGRIKVLLPEEYSYCSVGSMTQRSELPYFYEHGYAFPKDCRVTYGFDEETSMVSMRFDANTTLKMQGKSSETLQCLLPHQWKKAGDDVNLMGICYPTIRGLGKLHEGSVFTTRDRFLGILPTLGLPENENYRDRTLIRYLKELDDSFTGNLVGADAYWQGKSIHPLAAGVMVADMLGQVKYRNSYLQKLRSIYEDWFHYDGGADEAFFFYDKEWGTLYYGASEFGANTGITDHHFTYGYMVYGAVVLATYDDDFYEKYRDFIDLFVRDYASPYKDDSLFCRFRNFDMYEGHSWAGGYADNNSGNNQEAAGESLFGWVGEYLWGLKTGNREFRDAGIMGFTTEMNAVKQYWFNYDGDNWLDDWSYKTVGQIYGSTYLFGTFFNGNPICVYGIHWLPLSEFLTYYGMEQQSVAEMYQGLENDTIYWREKNPEAADDIPGPDEYWQHLTWTLQSQFDPEAAEEKFDKNPEKVQTSDRFNAYVFIQCMKELGTRTDDIYAQGGVSCGVYKKGEDYTAMVWNPNPQPMQVQFCRGDEVCGSAVVSGKSLVRLNPLKMGQTQAEAPVISVASGKYEDTQYITMETKTAGARIYYTTDGTRPTEASTPYNGPIVVSETTSLAAVAVQKDSISSGIRSSEIVIEAKAITGTENLARGKETEASSVENEGLNADQVTDGNYSSRWASKAEDDAWICVDLGEEKEISKAVLTWESAHASAYRLQISSNGEDFVDVACVTDSDGGTEEFVFDVVSARYVRMQGEERATEYGYSLYEFEVYGAEQIETPVIEPRSGTYQGRVPLSIRCGTKGVRIYYTLDGSAPDESSLLYVPGIILSESATVRASAFKKGMKSSLTDSVTLHLEAAQCVGDVNGDEKVTALDALLAMKCIMGELTLDEQVRGNVDVDGDGMITWQDVTGILEYSSGIKR
ncbi:MAG: discoidin domain-containing protein [Lachnospiraceae bacterium]